MTRTRYVPADIRHGRLPNLPREGFPFECGNCGAAFASKGDKARHKQGGCSAFNTGQGAPVDDAGKFGRPQDHITPEIKARAAAEWAAMDARGRLPKGWSYQESKLGGMG